MIAILLLLAFFILEVLAAIGVGGKINLTADGLACFPLAMLFNQGIL